MSWQNRIWKRAGAYGGLLAFMPFLLALIGWSGLPSGNATRTLLSATTQPPPHPELRPAPPAPGGGGNLLLDAAPPLRVLLPRPAPERTERIFPQGADVRAVTLAELGRRQTDGG